MTIRDELIEAAARAFLNAIREEESMLCYVDSDPQLDAVMIDGDVDMYRAMGAALDAILAVQARYAASPGIPIHASRDATNDVLDLAIKPDATGKFEGD
jgi:hypothetical protein